MPRRTIRIYNYVEMTRGLIITDNQSVKGKGTRSAMPRGDDLERLEEIKITALGEKGGL